SHKRQARTELAERDVSVIEALFQDAVRLELDNLYTAYVNALAARETIRYARASVAGLARALEVTEALYKRSTTTRPDVDRMSNLKNRAEMGLNLAEETYR